MTCQRAALALLLMASVACLAPQCAPEPQLETAAAPLAGDAGGPPLLSMVRYTLVSQRPVSRFVYELTYRAQVDNRSGADLLATGHLSTGHPNLTIVDGELDFGLAPHSQLRESLDTFTLLHDRTASFGPDDLVWSFDYTPMVTIATESANASEATIDMAGGELSATGDDGTVYTLTVPPGALGAATPIRITPISSVTGTAFGDNQLGGVVGEPSGLVFAVPVTLTMDLAGPAPLRAIGLISRDDGLPMQLRSASSQGSQVALQATHFSPVTAHPDAAALEAACATAERQYFGPGGLKERLEAIDSCGHPDLKRLLSDAINFQRLGELIGQSAECKFARSQKCFEPSWDPGDPGSPCSSIWEAGASAGARLAEVMLHFFPEDDLKCVDGLVDESALLRCIELAHQAAGFLPDPYDSLAGTLASEKTCGVSYVDLTPAQCLGVGESEALHATLRDANGVEVAGDIGWISNSPDILSLDSLAGPVVTATGLAAGRSIVEALWTEDPVYFRRQSVLQVVDLSGLWETHEVVDARACGDPIETFSEVVSVSQTADSLEVSTSEGTLAGSIATSGVVGDLPVCGVVADFRVTGDEGVTYGQMRLELSSDGESLYGTVPWTYSETGFSCPGTTDLSLVRTALPPPLNRDLVVTRKDTGEAVDVIRTAETLQLVATVTDEHGTPLASSQDVGPNTKFLWLSSDPDVLLADGTGRIHGVRGGSAALTARYEDLSVVLPVTVQAVPLVEQEVEVSWATRFTGNLRYWNGCELAYAASNPLLDIYYWLERPGIRLSPPGLWTPIHVLTSTNAVAPGFEADPAILFAKLERSGLVGTGVTPEADLAGRLLLGTWYGVPEGERIFHAFELGSIGSDQGCPSLSGTLYVYADHVAQDLWTLWPLDVVTRLPYQPNVGGAPTRIYVDISGADYATVSDSGPVTLLAEAVTASLANFEAVEPWRIVDRSHSNPVSQDASPSFIVMYQTSDIDQIDVEFSVDPVRNEVVIESLRVWHCTSISACPAFEGALN